MNSKGFPELFFMLSRKNVGIFIYLQFNWNFMEIGSEIFQVYMRKCFTKIGNK